MGVAAFVSRGSPLQPDVVTIIETKGRAFTSSCEEEVAAMESDYLGHSPLPTIIQSPYSFAETVSPCVMPSYHHILECSPSTIPSVPFHLQSLSSGSLAILLFQATTLQTKQPKKLP